MGSANTHLTHLEELVLTQGPRGYELARAFLLELLQTLKGNSESKVQTSVKWDGAPAMFAGINPENGKFFVGTKSIFNKVPKINYTEEDIIRNHGHAPGLVDKLTKGLKYLPSLGIQKILQGDFMFDDEMLEIVNIDGEPHYRFKPNTIVYAVPVNSKLGKKIGQSKFGIVFHTTYDSLDSGASFGADVSNLKDVPGIWYDDAFFTDDTGTVTLTEDEEARVIQLVKEADQVNQKINYTDMPSALLNIYINSEIKAGGFLDNPEESFSGFVNWYSQRLEKKIEKLKSDRGRARATESGRQALQAIEAKKQDILDLFKVSRLLFEAKNIFIQKYNNAVYNTKHFVDDGSGDLVATNPEGYVAVDHEGNGIKFVDRLEFSRANFLVDKSAKFSGDPAGVSESTRLTSEFTVVISKDVQITKTLKEWVEEAKSNNHKFQKLPQMVYNDVLSGVPIVDIVTQENAEKTIYNTVISYVKGLQEDMADEELEFEITDDENIDPVVDVEASKPMTYAIVPGAFKPPHAGHADMVRRYATGDGVPKADEVRVVISAPMNAQRTLRDGTVINEDHAIELWKQLFPEVASLPNVEFEVAPSTMRSPVTVAFEYIGDNSPLPLNPGDNVVLGASDKPDSKGNPDWMRWANIKDEYVKDGITLLAGEQFAVPAFDRPSGKSFSATAMRDLISDLAEEPGNKEAMRELSEFIPEDKIDLLFAILGIPTKFEQAATVAEMSGAGGAGGGNSMSAGSAAIGAGKSTWVSMSDRNPRAQTKKKKKKKPTKENIDLSIIDEVLALIIEKGIGYERATRKKS